jgi:REP element-mobilizing transposase RayT
MPRANRYFIPGQIWHITQRCHKKEFLLKFKRDRERWLYWLFEAKKRFGLTILNYMVTSNHIHLLVLTLIIVKFIRKMIVMLLKKAVYLITMIYQLEIAI